MLKVSNIIKKLDKNTILKDISLEVKLGTITSIIGPSGSGKTTLLKALSLLDLPNSGTITLDDINYTFPLNTKNIVSPWPKVSVVFQQFFIWPHLTIKQNITLALKGNIDEKHFAEVVELFQMNEFLDRYPNEVSLGQRQRAALARALMLDPKYLLLDEVTSALDVEQSHIILGHLRQIAEQGVGIIFVTHAIHLASKISDKVIFIDEGKIIEEGTSDILKNPKTERLKRFINISEQTI